ncbi:hypothetical protein DMA11_13625 [Marinilabiliaceae bacterium JC017]|nr:hypothetical protein DMA11_13625 [Marinilabiliaceae bacterium JC017]
MELSITDDPDFGCTVQLSDTKDEEYQKELTMEQIMNSKEKYLLLQHSYPEEYDNTDFYYLETTETDTELGDNDRMMINMSKNEISFQWAGDQVNIGLNLKDAEYNYLKEILENRFQSKIFLTELSQ